MQIQTTGHSSGLNTTGSRSQVGTARCLAGLLVLRRGARDHTNKCLIHVMAISSPWPPSSLCTAILDLGMVGTEFANIFNALEIKDDKVMVRGNVETSTKKWEISHTCSIADT